MSPPAADSDATAPSRTTSSQQSPTATHDRRRLAKCSLVLSSLGWHQLRLRLWLGRWLRVGLDLRIVDWKLQRFDDDSPQWFTDLHVHFLQAQNLRLMDGRLLRRARQRLRSEE